MQHINNILKMTSSKVLNYGIAGVDSSLITKGLVRIFECSRDHQEAVTPHSHKFDFSCLVLSGKVVNRVWKKDKLLGDRFQVSELKYLGEMGKYGKTPIYTEAFSFEDSTYTVGDWYSMKAEELHSIFFSRGTKVLFFEGETLTDTTLILDPYVNGKHVETFDIKPWMFEKL